MDLGIAGENALVLAGTGGLAFDCARCLAEAGATVAINGRDAERGAAAAAALGHGTRFIQGDVADPNDRARIVAEAQRLSGPPAILITNAAGPPPGGFLDHGLDAWRRAFETNELAAIDIAQRCLPAMIERGFGRIVNITSFTVREPLPNLVLSNGVRVGLHGAMATLAREVAGDGVTVNNILPGFMDTGALARVIDGQARRENIGTEEARDRLARSIPAGRLGDAADFGPLCAFLCSRLAGYITGQSVAVDGGVVRGLQV